MARPARQHREPLGRRGNELAVLRENGFVTSAAFSPSGDRILTAAEAARVGLVRGEDLLKLADERVTREFTQDERRRYADLIAADAEGAGSDDGH